MRRIPATLGAVLLAAVLALAACAGQAGVPSPSPSIATTPTPSPTPDPILVSIDRASPTDTIRMRRMSDGSEVAKTEVPSGSVIAGVGGGRVVWLEAGTVLKAMDTQGKVTPVAQLPAPSAGKIVLSPDGTRWAWTRTEVSGAQIHSVVYVKDKPVVDSTEAARIVQPVEWTARGIVVEHATTGLGGYIPLGDVTGRTELLNPDSGARKALTDEGCLFLDLATDGTFACRIPARGLWGARTIHIVHADGSKADIDTPVAGHFQYAGAASFRPDLQTQQMVIGGATGSGATGTPPGAGERYETDVIDLTSNTMRPYGPTGLEPGAGSWAWAPGSWLVSWRPDGAAGGEPGIYLVALTGATHRLAKSGQPVGVIAGSSSGGGGGGPL
jgi:hypothetical protein